ncbi:UspA domain-containing protein (fragment) [Paraburkholderia piptadeniae]|uniref:UspA domain-containing protein n=1 Tax=Paraburkholderia piptadeniae TaxID=1701573 RepID=A0A1N7ST54_9BURK
MIVWDGGRAATRAWHDALPLLQRATHGRVVMLAEPEDDRPATGPLTSEFATALRWYGV